MNPVATSDAAFRGGACPTPEYTIAYTGNYTTSADANLARFDRTRGDKHLPLLHLNGLDRGCFTRKQNAKSHSRQDYGNSQHDQGVAENHIHVMSATLTSVPKNMAAP